MTTNHFMPTRKTTLRFARRVWLLLLPVLVAGCAPSATSNVIGYALSQRVCDFTAWAAGVDTVECFPDVVGSDATGAIRGTVVQGGKSEGAPIADAVVLVADPSGQPFVARADAQGRYRIDGVPPGQYVPAGVAPGFAEAALHDSFGIPTLVTVRANETAAAPPLQLHPYVAPRLPDSLAESVQLTRTAHYTATAPFPPGSAAEVHAYQFTYNGGIVDTLRLYLPLDLEAGEELPILYMVYPLNIDGWQSVSVAFAAQGYALLAISPSAARALDIDAHALDAWLALTLAQEGELSAHVSGGPAVALGGSFSSPIVRRLLRTAGDDIAGWITVGGIADAFGLADDFYAGRIGLPERYRYAIPAFGAPNIYPVPFLRYSPLYAVDELPPTMVIHTDADTIVRIEQAYQFEDALRAAGVPVEVYYYEDVSHYLQIDEHLTDAGREMFERVLSFTERTLSHAQTTE